MDSYVVYRDVTQSRSSAASDVYKRQGQGQDHKNWPRGASRPRPGLEDYITDMCDMHSTPVSK